MSTTFKIQSELVQRSERAKSLEFHPTKPWILVSLHSGAVYIWNYQSQTTEKTFKVTDLPARTAKFVPSRNWVIVGSDDGFIRVYDYTTEEKIKEFEAHKDYVRCVAVHPTLPYVLSGSDDNGIKLWNWDKNWDCAQVFEGHSHYVMHVAFNPQDTNTFASASLDGTIKIWNIHSRLPDFTLDAHSKGLNYVGYYLRGDTLYLLSGSDDHTAKIWDCGTKTCVQTLAGHTNNVTAICALPEPPILITGSEDETVRIWGATEFKLEETLTFNLGRIWDIRYETRSSRVAFACDNGMKMVKIVKEDGLQS